MLWRSARQAIGRMLKREFEPQQETPENIRQLVAQLDAEGTGEKQEVRRNLVRRVAFTGLQANSDARRRLIS